jgi:TIR domain
MSTVFISYCRRDHFFAELARLKLAEAKIPVWVDQTNLRAGDDWRKEIDRGISDSFVVVVALSADSVNSPYVTYEWASAIGKDKPIVPVILSDCERHPRLEPIQYVDFSNSAYQPWQQLIDRITDIRTDAEQPASEDESNSERADDSTTEESLAEQEKAVELILNYLNRRGYQMASFDRIKDRIGEKYEPEFLEKLIASYPTVFRRARLKGGKPGLAKL